MSKAGIEEILALQTGSLATRLPLLDYRCDTDGAHRLGDWRSSSSDGNFHWQLTVTTLMRSNRTIPANRTAGEFVIAPQSIPWLNAINDYSKGFDMATNLVVRNVDEDIALALKQLAASHGRSAEAEHREILRNVLQRPPRRSVAEVLSSMPNVGDDAEFNFRNG